MKEAGEVIATNSDRASLRFHRTGACSKCGACGMLSGQSEVVVTAKNTLGARVGDRVEVEFASANVLRSTMIAYVFPLCMLLFGVVLGYLLPQDAIRPKDALAAVLGLVFGFGSFFIIKLLNPILQKKYANVYTMVRIVDRDAPDEESTE